MEIQDIKTRLTLAQVLQYYHLKPDKNMRLCCPFHEDKTPSLQVYYKTHTAYCFSTNCQTHGKAIDAVDFIMYMERTTKHEAIKKAVELVGGESNTKSIPMDQLTRSAVLLRMFTYFRNAISNSPQAREYILSRQLDIEKIEIGYNSGQFHHVGRFVKPGDPDAKLSGEIKKQELIQSCIKYGLLLDLNAKARTGEAAYKSFGKWCIVFALKNKEQQIAGLYFRSILNDKEQRHYYLRDRQGLYPYYPEASTKRLILTESIIDAATLLQIDKIKNYYSILALYGTNGLTEEHQQAIRELKQLEEVIFFLNGDEPGIKAVEKYAALLRVENKSLSITNVEVPQGEDVNSLLQAHSPEILIHLIDSRKELNFFLSSEKSSIEGSFENKKVESIEININADSNSANEQTKQEQITGLNASNPYNIVYQSKELKYHIKGFRLDQMDSLKITLQTCVQ